VCVLDVVPMPWSVRISPLRTRFKIDISRDDVPHGTKTKSPQRNDAPSHRNLRRRRPSASITIAIGPNMQNSTGLAYAQSGALLSGTMTLQAANPHPRSRSF
jgi:hypothetical protein